MTDYKEIALAAWQYLDELVQAADVAEVKSIEHRNLAISAERVDEYQSTTATRLKVKFHRSLEIKYGSLASQNRAEADRLSELIGDPR